MATRRRKKHRIVRYTDRDITNLLINRERRPSWERTAHLIVAAKQRGFRGSELSAAVRFLDDTKKT